ncbi:TniQ family protein [Synechocystis sp. CACIAM 05]|uniref:TniQ family protein n=1 Tax=Synechocystis sp. CACIAM 05 TaxID=1933929 RepID=UPI00138E68FC|nr:TniQ family protein [Synechocystis sp. CACIAM 05]QHU98944.1 hypothetical protein BWK47_01550 [Synechocystis sp. CACIAM 05]
MSTEMELKPWLFRVEPLPGESLSHFLGRVRRQNHLSPGGLGQLAGIGAVVSRWEKFRHNPFPSPEELGALGDLLGIDVAVLRAMLPPVGESLKMEPIRLCGACCGEESYHRLEWQFQSTWRCAKHGLLLLSRCPKCRADFEIPALWEFGGCKRCGTPYGALEGYQKRA